MNEPYTFRKRPYIIHILLKLRMSAILLLYILQLNKNSNPDFEMMCYEIDTCHDDRLMYFALGYIIQKNYQMYGNGRPTTDITYMYNVHVGPTCTLYMYVMSVKLHFDARLEL